MQTLLITRPDDHYHHIDHLLLTMKPFLQSGETLAVYYFARLSSGHPLLCCAIGTSYENHAKVFQIKNSTDFTRKINNPGKRHITKNKINELKKKNYIIRLSLLFIKNIDTVY